MASIKALRDSNNETIYPQTLTNAIFDLNNQSLDNLLALKMDASKVYTKEEMNNIISTLSSLKFEVLQKNEDGTIPDLPAVGDTDTIYLRPKENDDTNNYYDEYIYLENGTYEKIGDTKVDLSNYYTKGEADTKFTNTIVRDPSLGYLTKQEEYSLLYTNGGGSYQEGIFNVSIFGNFIEFGNKQYIDNAMEYVSNNAMPKSNVVTTFWSGTQAEYDAIATKDATTLYMITG